MSECEHNGYRYECSTEKVNFLDAHDICVSNGGNLARYLNEDAYIKLNECCTNDKKYWIGLIESPKCLHWQYTWIGTDTCVSASPLSVQRLFDLQEIEAVTIKLDSGNPKKLPDAFEEYSYANKRYICQYSLTTPTTQTLPTTAGSTANTISHSTATATTSAGSTEAQTVQVTSPFTDSSTHSQNVSTTNSTPTSSGTTSVARMASSSGLISGMVVGGTLLIFALVLLYFFFIRNGYCKKFKNVGNQSTESFTPQNQAEDNIKEVKENPLYGRVISTSESHQVCYGVNSDSVEINGSASDPSNAYQMAEDIHSKTIPGKLNNNLNPSNEYEIDNLENDYNKLYFPKQQDDATSSTYGRLDHENNMPHKNSANVYTITP